MTFFHRDRARVYSRQILFEELEERIVMDASVDPNIGAADFFGQVSVDPIVAPPQASANWTLDYSSNASTSMIELMDYPTLAAADVQLGNPPPGIILGALPTISSSATAVDLSSVIRINGDPSEDMTITLVPNPRPLTSAGISSLVINGAVASTIEPAPPDSINAQLATLQANLVSGFSGMAEIDIRVSDPEYGTAGGTALAARTLLIPINASPIVTLQVPSGVITPISGLSVADPGSTVHELGILLKADHGTLTVPQQSPSLLIPSITFFGTEGPNSAPLETAQLVGIRGQLPELQNALNAIEYRSLPGYTGSDTITQVVTDSSFRPVNQANVSTTTISINVV
jgi:hypothetical protein